MGSLAKIRAAEYKKYLESLPEEVYNLDSSSHMVRFLDALCDSGVGALRKELLADRIATSLDETYGSDLDAFYGDLFGLKRLPEETYNIDGTTHTSFSEQGLLNAEQTDIMREKDAKYRARIWAYITALQAAGTYAGIKKASYAAFGYNCYVLEAGDYYATNNIKEDVVISKDRVITPPQYNGADNVARYDSILIIVDKDKVTQAEKKYAFSAIGRLLPQDIVAKIISRKEAANMFALEPESEIKFAPKTCEGSSTWWERTRYVTGAENWSYEYDPNKNFWVKPNIRTEAPLLVEQNSQEFVTDYTYMVNKAEASSVHVGAYNKCQTDIYSLLATTWAQSEHPAFDALSSTINKTFSIGLDGETQVIDGTYPIDYLPAVLPEYQEQSAQRRMWSSEERKEQFETVEFYFQKEVPLNNIKLNVFIKPWKLKVEVLVEDKWQQITSKNTPIHYVSDSWGGTSLAGETLQIDFNFDIVKTSAVRFTFERTQDFRLVDVGGGKFRKVNMVYSIDIEEVKFYYKCLSRENFIESSYSDCFGNLVETELKTYPSSNVTNSTRNYWLSQPNITPNAVEFLIFDVRDENGDPQAIDFIEIDSVISGAQMNIYSAYEEENGGHTWYPYSSIFILKDGRYELEERVCSFIKLEFTNLTSIMYDVAAEGIVCNYNLFPTTSQGVSNSEQNSSGQTKLEQLLETSSSISTSTDSVSNRYLKTGLDDIYANLDKGETLSSQLSANNVLSYDDLWQTNTYRSDYRLGTNTKTEQSLGLTTQGVDWSFDNTPSYSYFAEVTQHNYAQGKGERNKNVAYVVAIRSVIFGRSEGSTLYEKEGVFYAKANDDRFTDNLFNMEKVENGISPVGNKLAVYESRNFDTLCLFDNFDFAVSMKEPEQVFKFPSEMVNEWSSLKDDEKYMLVSADMGSSGTVARLPRHGEIAGEGIISEPMFVQAEGVAEFSVRIYDYARSGAQSSWIVECLDGEEVLYTMFYKIERGGWHTLNSAFQLQPAGGWWNSDYCFRCKLDISGGETGFKKGDSFYVPILDMLSTSNSVESGQPIFRAQDDLSDVRVVYYNGTMSKEIPRYITGNHELWFAIQEDIGIGKDADGTIDKETHNFKGCYYLYYGAYDEDTHQYIDVNRPLNNENEIFEGHILEDSRNSLWNDNGIANMSRTQGYVAFDWTPPYTINKGDVYDEEGNHIRGYLYKWESETGDVKSNIHIYEDTLVFDIYDGDFRSSCSGSLRNGDIVKDKPVRILGNYDKLKEIPTNIAPLSHWFCGDGRTIGNTNKFSEVNYPRGGVIVHTSDILKTLVPDTVGDGEEIILSFDFRLNEGGISTTPILVYPYQNNGISIKDSYTLKEEEKTTSWKRVSLLTKAKNFGDNGSYTIGCVYIYDRAGMNNFSIRNVQIERVKKEQEGRSMQLYLCRHDSPTGIPALLADTENVYDKVKYNEGKYRKD